jgi:hypothetical protein
LFIWFRSWAIGSVFFANSRSNCAFSFFNSALRLAGMLGIEAAAQTEKFFGRNQMLGAKIFRSLFLVYHFQKEIQKLVVGEPPFHRLKLPLETLELNINFLARNPVLGIGFNASLG